MNASMIATVSPGSGLAWIRQIIAASALAHASPVPATTNQARAGRSRLRLACWGIAVAVGFGVAVPKLHATELHYGLMSPNFGGSNTVPYQMAQAQASLIATQRAAAAAAAKAAAAKATAADPYAPLISALTSQLTGLVAHNIADRIANSKQGDAGTISTGNVAITYVNSDGQLSVTISSPTGSTTLTIPSGS
ncbi:Curli production assembly/transport component CsgF [Rhodovastum atsumiense]|nr:curli assembly protein CsgF [Rhodovastum atsumiense]CAH2602899.1 Curli production assembly/transport component CsgF [Rhodovastum atsumiense]